MCRTIRRGNLPDLGATLTRGIYSPELGAISTRGIGLPENPPFPAQNPQARSIWSIRYDNCSVIADGSPFSWENTPARAPEPEDVSPNNNGAGGGGVGVGRERGTKERRWGWGLGGGKRMCCDFWAASSLGKNLRPLHLNSTHISFGRLQLLLHLWSVALSRIDSRWKKCTLARHSWHGLQDRIRIWNNLKSRIWIRTKSFRINNTAYKDLQKIFFTNCFLL